LISEGFEPLPSNIDSVAKEDSQQAEEDPTDSALEDSNLLESTRIEVEFHIEKKAKEESKTPRQTKHSPKTIKRYASWQAEAGRFWAMRQHRNKGKCAIARLIEKTKAGEGRSWKTIRLKIHK
jgi:hypothetical protein